MIALLFFLAVSNPRTPQDIFQAGVRAELEGNPAEAQSQWEKLSQMGLENADVEFNLGTSYADAGEIGPAILHLRRAALLRPGADVTANLQMVRERLLQQNPGKTSESSVLADLAALLVRVPLEAALGVALILASLAAFLRWGPRPWHSGLAGAFVWITFVTTVLFAVLLGVRNASLDGKPAVVVMKRTKALNGPDERFKTLAELVPGEELWLLPGKDASLGFIAVQLGNGDTAYVNEGSVAKVKDW